MKERGGISKAVYIQQLTQAKRKRLEEEQQRQQQQYQQQRPI